MKVDAGRGPIRRPIPDGSAPSFSEVERSMLARAVAG
jgi:hypothetical protein